MRGAFVGRAECRLGRLDGLLQLLQLATYFVEAIAKLPDERVELADQLVLKGEPYFQVFDPFR
jgi:hypothetical protein